MEGQNGTSTQNFDLIFELDFDIVFSYICLEIYLDADEKLQYFQLPYIPYRMASGNKTKVCLKYFFVYQFILYTSLKFH
jgi:hypothetical protein